MGIANTLADGTALLQQTLNLVSRNLFLELLFPKWLLRWGTPLMRDFHIAHGELRVS